MSLLTDITDHLLNNAKLRRPATDPDGGFAVTQDMVRPGPPSPVSLDATVPGAVPARAIFVSPTGGTPGGGRDQPDGLTAQLTVRSDPYDFDAGLDLATAVYEAVHLKPPPGYFDAIAFSGPPSHVNQDEQGQHLFVINLRLMRGLA